MSKRIAVFLITATFLLSAWSNVIAASFCPRYSARDFSVNRPVEKDSPVKSEPCHHEMAGMNMDAESQITTNEPLADTPNPASAVLELPGEPCGHCWMHSQPSGAVVAQSPSWQSVEADAPPADWAITVPLTFVIPITPFEHGPPGDSLPRHVLINVFRI